MKILISNDGYNAHYFIRNGWGRVFASMNYKVVLWDIHKKSAFDAFDSIEPDIFFGQTYNTTPAVAKCIRERPNMKVIMKAPDWSDYSNNIVKEGYPILTVSQQEIDTIIPLFEETGKPDLLQVHYHPDWVPQTHKGWFDYGMHVMPLLSAADVFLTANGTPNFNYTCDLAFVGGYWPYKSQTLDKYLLSLCKLPAKYRIRIFGNKHWPVPQYCGSLPHEEFRNLFASTKVGINISEPHSQVYGFDIIERPFKVMMTGVPLISDYVEGLYRIFGDLILYAKTPDEFANHIDNLLSWSDQERKDWARPGYEVVRDSHTYFNRIEQILYALDLAPLIEDCQFYKQEAFKKLGVS